MGERKHVVVIGAGASGLCAAKYAISFGYNVTVYEQSAQIGGTWIYSEEIGNDIHGLPIHTSMYKNLQTNLPVEIMGFHDYNVPNHGRSFVTSDKFLDFLVSYANHYHVTDKIKFEHQIIRVTPSEDNKWEVLVKDLKSEFYDAIECDYVFVCNGHNSKPTIPKFSGQKDFKGKQIHSHSYRRPDAFEGEDVLIIGAGPSGKDIIYDVATKARSIVFSTHANVSHDIFPSNVTVRPDVREFKSNSVVFVDGHEDRITTILFCTGYKFSFPFLSLDTGASLLSDYYVHPLYKHIININHPTMAFIGLQMVSLTTLIFDLQIRFCFNFWNGQKILPSKEEMLEETRVDIAYQWARGISKQRAHLLKDQQVNYCYQLAEVAGIEAIKQIYFTIYYDNENLRLNYPNSYRLYNYRIIDNDTYNRDRVKDNNN